MRTAVYVDGFNLYHGALEHRPSLKWLDLKAMAAGALQPANRIVRVRYFTARVTAPTGDPDMPTRQDAYLRALKAHIPELSIHFGKFTEQKKTRRVVNPPPRYVEVWHREEKGSDVNLAVHMLNDAWRDEFDCAVVVSNDSDLAEALTLVRGLGKVVGILTTINRPTKLLHDQSNFFRRITDTHLKNSQLPDPVAGSTPGQLIHRPASWA